MKISNKIKERHFIPMGFGVLTVSDSRTLTNDKSGDILENRILNAGHNIVARDLVKDSKVTIKKILKKWILTKNLDVIISTGGTGLTGRDVTVEAHNDLYEKKINAFEILFTKVSIETMELLLFKAEHVQVLHLVPFFLHYQVLPPHVKMHGIKFYVNNLIIEIYHVILSRFCQG